jgi:hypothetical protein
LLAAKVALEIIKGVTNLYTEAGPKGHLSLQQSSIETLTLYLEQEISMKKTKQEWC